jgi:hypothetical protein
MFYLLHHINPVPNCGGLIFRIGAPISLNVLDPPPPNNRLQVIITVSGWW